MMLLEGHRANFLGDSITAGVGTSGEDAIYLNVLAKRCGLAAARNYGVSGTRIARQNWAREAGHNEDNNFCARAGQMNPAADLIVVFGGTNDFGHGDAPLGTPADRTRDTYIGALHELFRLLIEKYPRGTIVVLTPLHRDNEDCPYGDNRRNQAAPLSEYVRILCEVAAYYSLPVCDLYRTSGIQPAIPVLRELFLPDGLHPSDAGNRRIADRLEAFLRAL